MRKLPPLNSLRAFEAAARFGSFVLAGQELGVSSAAVSLQVKTLEENLGKKLFLRQGNRILLTDAGVGLFPRVGSALDEISDAAQALRRVRRSRQLVISVVESFAELWLISRWNAPSEVVHPLGYVYPDFRRTEGCLENERSPKISC